MSLGKGKRLKADLIKINAIALQAICGVLPQEKLKAQPFEISLEMEVDLTKAGETDNLEDTVDYGSICEAVEKLALEESFDLIERFAKRVVEETFAQDNRINAVSVSLKKLQPPVDAQLGSTEVVIYRQKPR